MTPPDLDGATGLLAEAHWVITSGLTELKKRGGPDKCQNLAYDIAHAASALATAKAALRYGQNGDDESRLAAAFLALALRDLAVRVLGHEQSWGVADDWYRPFAGFVATHASPAFLSSLATASGDRHLGDDFQPVAELFHRFADEQVRPHAEHVHRTNGDIPESIISGLAELGGFGLSIPEAFGGFSTGGESEYLGMVVATEELSWGSLGIGGSLITRPEIMTRALLSGGTSAQKEQWLPRLASAEVLAAIAVTEPDFGSDVASINTTATRTTGGWVINGTKTWCTFAARANVLVLLARTDPTGPNPTADCRFFSWKKRSVTRRDSCSIRTTAPTDRADSRGGRSTPWVIGACTPTSSVSTIGSCPTTTWWAASRDSARGSTSRWPASKTVACRLPRARLV